MPFCKFSKYCCCCWKKNSAIEDDDDDCLRKDEVKLPIELENDQIDDGNPRNKCALQPGHSLMDWIRLGASGKDLTGVGSNAGHLSVTSTQLAQHNTQNDAWLAIRGKIYNVTHYLPFHPGGVEELMKGVGTDATCLFDQIHPWVNYEQILQKCYIGRLKSGIDLDIDPAELFFGKSEKPVSNDSNKDATVVNLPRFDWIQKLDYITIIFYTKALSNPLIEINKRDNSNVYYVLLTYADATFVNEVAFLKNVQWPCETKVTYETGKIELKFKKNQGEVWENFGLLKQKSKSNGAIDDIRSDYVLIKKINVNHNTFLMELEKANGCKMVVPLGQHVRIFSQSKNGDISRSYTPVPQCLFTKFKSPQIISTDSLCLMIKRYPEGIVSRFVCDGMDGDVYQISKPLGSFDLLKLERRETFLILAAGTGITPMLSIILFLLERRIRKCRNVQLVFFNKTQQDILFKEQFDQLQSEDERFKIQNVLSQPECDWTGLKGHISIKFLEEIIEQHLKLGAYKQNDLFVMVCGPDEFTSGCYKFLIQLEFNQQQIHLFQG